MSDVEFNIGRTDKWGGYAWFDLYSNRTGKQVARLCGSLCMSEYEADAFRKLLAVRQTGTTEMADSLEQLDKQGTEGGIKT